MRYFPAKANNGENSDGFTIPCYRADGAKVATKERVLGGHAINWHSARFMGGISAIGCLSPKILLGEFPIAAHKAEQHRKQAGGGVVYFGYFLLDRQKKVTRQSGETDLVIHKLNFQTSNAPSDPPSTAPAHPRHKANWLALSNSLSLTSPVRYYAADHKNLHH